MTVGDLARHMRALAEIVGAAKGVGKDLEAASKALAPFANNSLEKFAARLERIEQKYGEAGELPDIKPDKPKPATRPKGAETPAAPKPSPEQLVARIAEIKADLNRGVVHAREDVTAEINKFDGLTQKQLDEVMLGSLGFPKKIKGKEPSIAAVVDHILANRGAELRSKP